MSKFFSTRNLVSQAVEPCVPWEWNQPRPADAICTDKSERQFFYKSAKTEWNFYCGVEGANNNQRVSKSNPPRYIHAFIGDYDLPLSIERINEGIETMSVKPQWIEQSLGGNCRLIWLLSRPLAVETADFAVWVLQSAKKFLSLDLLPGLDSAAFEDPARTYCNGANWTNTNYPPIDESKLQNFFVDTARKFKFTAPEGNSIPLDTVEKSIRARFPHFQWPTSFDLDSQGPSFFIPESVSPLSAIVKMDGMLSFSAHASKPFYSWAEILGANFVKETNEKAISRATLDIFHDGHNYWRKIDSIYQTVSDRGMSLYLKEGCGIPAKKVDATLHHINENCRIAGAAPFVFQQPGLMEYGGRKVLNTWRNSVMLPAETAEGVENTWVWGFIHTLFDATQLPWFLAWFKHFYTSAVELLPRPGQNVFLFGSVNRGKTFLSRSIVAAMVGGFSDASQFLVNGDAFGSEQFHVPLWCVDDASPMGSTSGHDRFTTMLKRAAANQTHRYHCKFETPTLVSWAGRVFVTANTDFSSSRVLGSLDNSSADKTCIFRASECPINFPERYKLQAMLKTELPIFCRWLLDYEVPAYIPIDGRYGFAPYHEQTMVDSTHVTSRSAAFKEILIEELQAWFRGSPDATEWKGNGSALIRLMQANPLNDYLMRSFKPEQISRHLEQIEREGVVKCRTEAGENKTRLWVFPRL